MQIAQRKLPPAEQKVPLSRSLIWKLLRNYYQGRGPAAWSHDQVPHAVTSNPFFTGTYARAIAAWLQDCRKQELVGPATPVYVVELAAGHGRFAYCLLKQLPRLLEGSGLNLRYVITDFCEENLTRLRNHPYLEPFIADGTLDFARFDAGCDTELRLLLSGQRLSGGANRNPTIFIANYLFDSLPQDAFQIENSELYESLVSVSFSRDENLEDPTILSRAEISYHHSLASDAYYDLPEWNSILKSYRSRLPSSAFLFPVGALRSIDRLRQLSGDRLLLLTADKGYNRDDAIAVGMGRPEAVMHSNGCFSMMVDYQAIAAYCESVGGRVLQPARPCQFLAFCAISFGGPSLAPALERAYEEFVDDFGPDDFSRLAVGFQQCLEQLSIDQLLALLRFHRWAFQTFWHMLPELKSRTSQLADRKRELVHAMEQVWNLYLPLGEEADLAFAMGTLLLESGCYPEATAYLCRSVDLYGLAPGTAINMAICLEHLGRTTEALEWTHKALELDPTLESAKTMRVQLSGDLVRPASGPPDLSRDDCLVAAEVNPR
jgi:tetratricopeptide (TPR) repeat protein